MSQPTIWEQARQNIRMAMFMAPPQVKDLVDVDQATGVIDTAERFVEGTLDVIDDKFTAWSMKRALRRPSTPDADLKAPTAPKMEKPAPAPTVTSATDQLLDALNLLKNLPIEEAVKQIKTKFPDLNVTLIEKMLPKNKE